MYEFLLEEFVLDMEKLDYKYEYNLNILDIDMKYTAESVGSDVIKKIKIGIKYLVNLTILSIEELAKINKQRDEQLKIRKTIKVYDKVLTKCPDIAKEKVYIRAYKDLKDKDDDYDKKINHNLLTIMHEMLYNARNGSLLMQYNLDKAVDGYYEIPVKDALVELNNYYNMIEKEINEDIEDLKTLYKDVDKVANMNIDAFASLKSLLTKVKETLVKKSFIFYLNLDLFQYQLSHIVSRDVAKKADDVVVDTHTKEGLEKVINSAQIVNTMKVGDMEFRIYKTTYNDISCFNYKGNDIYVTNDFFNLPKGYQLAILYHEIGHTMSGHFYPLEIQDDEKKLKSIKKYKKKFDRMVYNSRYFNVENLNNDEELIYILTELDADRYSANLVGKHMMNSALKSTFNDMLKHSGLSKELIRYNKFRMKLRTKMI